MSCDQQEAKERCLLYRSKICDCPLAKSENRKQAIGGIGEEVVESSLDYPPQSLNELQFVERTRNLLSPLCQNPK